MSTQEIMVRPDRPADVATLIELLNEIIGIGGTTAYEQPLTPDQFEAEFLAGEHAVALYVAQLADSNVMGFQSIARNAALPDGWVDIATFARVAPKVPGIGRLLFRATVSKA